MRRTGPKTRLETPHEPLPATPRRRPILPGAAFGLNLNAFPISMGDNGHLDSTRMKYTVAIANTGESYGCAPDRNLLAAMEQLGRCGIPVGCRNGGCGVCKIQILDGDIATRVMSRAHVSANDEAAGIVLACRTFPRSDLSLQALDKMAACIEKSFERSHRQAFAATPRPAAGVHAQTAAVTQQT